MASMRNKLTSIPFQVPPPPPISSTPTEKSSNDKQARGNQDHTDEMEHKMGPFAACAPYNNENDENGENDEKRIKLVERKSISNYF